MCGSRSHPRILRIYSWKYVKEEEFNQELYRDDDEYFKKFYGESELLYELRFIEEDRYKENFPEYRKEDDIFFE